MSKHYLYLASSGLALSTIQKELDNLKAPYAIKSESATKGDIVSDDSFFLLSGRLISSLTNERHLVLTLLCTNQDNALSEKLLKEALSYFPNQAVFPSDVIMKELSFGDYSSLPLLSAIFKDVPSDLLETAGSYLRQGCNALNASKDLYIHRNTFNYRLKEFIRITGLDIRDYHNALLLELYFQLAAH